MDAKKLLSIIFGIIGLIFFLTGAYFIDDTIKFINNSVLTEGNVINLLSRDNSDDSGSVYYQVIQFKTPDNKEIEFTSGIGGNPPAYKSGESVLIRYSPANPVNARINSFFSLWFMGILFAGMGGLFITVSLIFIILVKKQKNRVEYLKNFGIPVSTQLLGVEQVKSVKVNNRHPFRIISKWVETGTNMEYIFKSQYLWENPRDFIHDGKITVIIDSRNPATYMMDTSFLP